MALTAGFTDINNMSIEGYIVTIRSFKGTFTKERG